MERKCGKCQLIKSLDLFSNDKNKKYGKSHRCKECNKQECNKRYYNKHEEYLKDKAEYYIINKERLNIKSRKYQKENRKKINEHNRKKNLENYEAYLQYCKDINKKRSNQTKEYKKKRWPEVYAKNREIYIIKSRERQLQIKLTCEDSNKAIIKVIYAAANRISKCIGIPFEVDHIIPIAKGGKHHEDNLQILSRYENRKKGVNIINNTSWIY